ncbi:MAG: phage portal protein, partial [Verrucomicrobiota bacterium]
WENEPCFQIYDTEEIATPPAAIAGLEHGRIILDGCELNPASKTTHYHIRGFDGLTWSSIERSRMIHWYKPHAVNQVRGISDLAQAVNPMVDFHELQRLATRSAKAQQLIALVLKGVGKKKTRGAFGAIKNAGAATDAAAATSDTTQLESISRDAGAGIAYLDSDGGAEIITPNTPAPNIEAWITSIFLPNAAASAGIPLEFFWPGATSKVGGAPMRFILSRASLFFLILGKGVKTRFCTPVAYRFLKHRMDTGKLRQCKDPNWANSIDWQGPPLVTVDNGNDGELQIELLANGLITLRQYCAARGLNYRHVMRQWIREPIEFLKMAKAEGAPDDMIARWQENTPIWRAGKPGAGMGQPGPKPKKRTDTDDEP